MAIAQKGSKVSVHYTGRLTDGTVFDSSEGRDPLAFEVGAGQMIPGFDAAVNGMSIGDKKTVTIPSEEAYGPKNEQMIMDVPKENLPEDMRAEVKEGMKLYMQTAQGQPVPVTVVGVEEASIKIDANHELAGKDLVFDIELVSVD
ncbi:MAG: peptidylprolyl isomerase [Cytophagales bacterium]|nr:peptidylprolyl isomerase [Cytophagales bacterium]